MYIKIQYKIFILFFTLIVFLLLITYNQINKIIENNFYNYLRNKIEKSEEALNNYLNTIIEKYKKDILLLAYNDELNNSIDNNQIVSIPLFLKKYKRESNFDCIQLYDINGQLLVNEGINTGKDTKNKIYNILKNNISSGIFYRNNKIMFITYSYTKNKNYVVSGIKIFDDRIAEEINNILGINFLLINNNNIQSANIFFKNIITKENFSIDYQLVELAKNGNKKFFISDKYSSIFYYVPVYDHNRNIITTAIISFNTDMLFSIKKQSKLSLLKIFIISFIITFLIIIIFSAHLTNPIRKITNWARIISEGNLSYREKIKSNDEIKELANVFNLMLNNLQNSMERINQQNIELTNANIKLMELDKMKNDFLASISHELKTPLTSINGFIKIMNKKMEKNIIPYIDIENEKIRNILYTFFDNMKIIEVEASKLTETILNLIDFVSIESNKIDWNVELVNVNELINEIIREKKNIIDKKELRLILNIDEENKMIAGDRKYFKKFMNHLFSNAINFTDKGYIKIESFIKENNWYFVVEDSGIGIDKKYHDVIFEKFRQLGDILTYKPHGLGIGLPLCKSIVDHYNGKILLESEVGVGSKFTVIIPLN